MRGVRARLGAAEQKALVAQQDLTSQKGESAALMGEIDSISKAFEEVNEQNTRLMEQLAAKEESSSRIMQERRKEVLTATLMRQEKERLEEQLAKSKELLDSKEQYRGALEQEVKGLKDSLGKREEERSKCAGIPT